eukprot:Gregarina_sp_Poly_1__4746@NODE_2535_length_2012_cov_4_634961_g1611_i0_p2_GENE_NODE_2535_length_2012_cov_4_634961_g1611_i0NODE_2535_length_2012_cov_4_634961_g1611_i0_p2_ORF_typecomplete_len101_score13_88_NODE_2535_length_2012_cov_4_634961_g1611_i09521254
MHRCRKSWVADVCGQPLAANGFGDEHGRSKNIDNELVHHRESVFQASIVKIKGRKRRHSKCKELKALTGPASACENPSQFSSWIGTARLVEEEFVMDTSR